jgi:uncharacterized SAM-binding protein YcdF (DUF218 family)
VTYIEVILPIVLLTAAVGLLRGFRSHRRGRWLLLGTFVGLAAMSWEPFSWLFSSPLESPYLQRPNANSGQAIVILSGAIDPPHWYRPYSVLGRDTFRRCLKAAWLYRSGLRVPMLATGAGAAEPMADFLASQGVPRQAIWTENASRNTHENAMYSAPILKAHGIRNVVLVTEAKAMLRAARSFEKYGVAVVPSPAVHTVVQTLLPNSTAIHDNSDTLHEFTGLLYYWLRGWI